MAEAAGEKPNTKICSGRVRAPVRSIQELSKPTLDLTNVTRIIMSGLPNNIEDRKVLASRLLKKLAQCHNLLWLDISKNFFFFPLQFSKVLAPALMKLSKLEHLNLGGNGLNLEDAQNLAPALAKLPNLQHLDLHENDLDYESVKALAAVLPQLKQLRKLDLSRNNLGLNGINAILAVLPKTNIEEAILDNEPPTMRALLNANKARNEANRRVYILALCSMRSRNNTRDGYPHWLPQELLCLTVEDYLPFLPIPAVQQAPQAAVQQAPQAAVQTDSFLEAFKKQPWYIQLAIILSGVGALVVLFLVIKDAISNLDCFNNNTSPSI